MDFIVNKQRHSLICYGAIDFKKYQVSMGQNVNWMCH